MADEFMKGLGLFTIGALGWFTFAGWYRVPTYSQVAQLTVPASEPNGVYDAVSILAGDVFAFIAIFGVLTFWVLIPVARELLDSRDKSSN